MEAYFEYETELIDFEDSFKIILTNLFISNL